jgi:hypothetical protein
MDKGPCKNVRCGDGHCIVNATQQNGRFCKCDDGYSGTSCQTKTHR